MDNEDSDNKSWLVLCLDEKVIPICFDDVKNLRDGIGHGFL
jgi:hypothetical protein